MVNQIRKQKLDSLLEKGIITQEEYWKLLRKECGNKSVPERGNFLKVISTVQLTVLAIIAILFGMCFLPVIH